MDRDNFLDSFFNHNYDDNNLPNFTKPMLINTNNILDNSKITRVSSTPSMNKCLKTKMEMRALIGSVASPNDVSSISKQNSVNETNKKFSSFVSRKRKSVSRGKSQKVLVDETDNQVKRCKSDENIGNNEKQIEKHNEPKTKAPDPPKDYIHVRARRGQATDSHSLAERVRREKISERMKLLQDLVPGCNKVTGKALILDEIINYVQSLQQQVEFLSMKLASVDPMDFNTGSLILGVNNSTYPSDPLSLLRQQQQDIHQARIDFSTLGSFDPSGTTLCREGLQQVPLVDEFGQFSGSYEDDLQSLVQMEFGQNRSSKPWFHSQIYPDNNLLHQDNE